LKNFYLLTILLLFCCIDVNAQRKSDRTRKSRNIERASKDAERRAKTSRRKAEEERKRAGLERNRKAQQDRRRKAQESARKTSDESARKYMELQRLKKEAAAKNPVRKRVYKAPVKVQSLPSEFKGKTIAEIQPYIKSLVTPLTIAKKLKIDFPPKEPIEDLESIKKRIDTLVVEKVDKVYPPSKKEFHYNKALEKYHLYAKGEMVEALRVRKTGRNPVVSGICQGLSRNGRLVIGTYELPKVEMTEDIMVHFDEALNDKKIEVYLANKLFYYYEDRSKMKEKLTREVQDAPLNKAGYFELEDSFYKAYDYIKALHKKESTEIKVNVYEMVKQRLLLKYDFESSSVKSEAVFSDINEYVFEEVSKLLKITNTPLFSPDFYKE
jgi:hypothetical protein